MVGVLIKRIPSEEKETHRERKQYEDAIGHICTSQGERLGADASFMALRRKHPG